MEANSMKGGTCEGNKRKIINHGYGLRPCYVRKFILPDCPRNLPIHTEKNLFSGELRLIIFFHPC